MERSFGTKDKLEEAGLQSATDFTPSTQFVMIRGQCGY